MLWSLKDALVRPIQRVQIGFIVRCFRGRQRSGYIHPKKGTHHAHFEFPPTGSFPHDLGCPAQHRRGRVRHRERRGNGVRQARFQITIPRVLFLQVGTGTFGADDTTVDKIDFAPTATQVINATTPIAGTGGNLTGGAVTARLFGNNGGITLSSTTLGALNNGGADTISWSEISTAVTPVSGTLPHPTLADTGSPSVTPTPNVGTKVTNLHSTWTYSYLNTAGAAAEPTVASTPVTVG